MMRPILNKENDNALRDKNSLFFKTLPKASLQKTNKDLNGFRPTEYFHLKKKYQYLKFVVPFDQIA